MLLEVNYIKRWNMSIFTKFSKIVNLVDYKSALAKTRQVLNTEINILNSKHKIINEQYFIDLEEVLLKTDLGIKTTTMFIKRLQQRVVKESVTNPLDIKELIVDELFIMYVDRSVITNQINFKKDGLTVILVVGVNGVGKTTSIAKLAYQLKQNDKQVLMIAADTFRAGAKEQLKEWGTRLDIPVYATDGQDSAAVVYEGINYAKDHNMDVVLIDTAGRIQNKDNLMQELAKINKVIKNLINEEVHETLLVIDATTGQNAINQAKSFNEIVSLTGIILTKLDGTAKGAIVLAIKEEVGVPVRYIGIGEAKEDLKLFDIEDYIYNLMKDGEL